ncbi:hypothetical protein L6164_026039 [Bauhinia variegata]|uniref:Uncharacterized protein n=1 Tax=Bauhinia variegata TaxID=167791 RepID=A0ACB9M2J2_BAUVA|nr:hypothetical protein L6164_026039 [Bauhinia variegata]
MLSSFSKRALPQQPPSDPRDFHDQRNPNQWDPRQQGHPQNQYQGHYSPGRYPNQGENYLNGVYPRSGNTSEYSPQFQRPIQLGNQGGSPSQWNNQTQPYPQSGKANQSSPQLQRPSQLNGLASNQGQVVIENQDPIAPTPSIIDLTRLCQEGKLKEAIELMDKWVKVDADCFKTLFDLCGKSKSLKDAKRFMITFYSLLVEAILI